MNERADTLFEPGERLGKDDQAAQVDSLFRAAAIAAHGRRRAHAAGDGRPGLCLNCSERCMPSTVYCDPDCRSDHEARLAARARRGDPPGPAPWKG